jgi:hypothetical protein
MRQKEQCGAFKRCSTELFLFLFFFFFEKNKVDERTLMP